MCLCRSQQLSKLTRCRARWRQSLIMIRSGPTSEENFKRRSQPIEPPRRKGKASLLSQLQVRQYKNLLCSAAAMVNNHPLHVYDHEGMQPVSAPVSRG